MFLSYDNYCPQYLLFLKNIYINFNISWNIIIFCLPQSHIYPPSNILNQRAFELYLSSIKCLAFGKRPSAHFHLELPSSYMNHE